MTANIAAVLDACNALITDALTQIASDDPAKHSAVLEFAKAGGIPRLTIETRPDLTTIGLTLIGEDDSVRIFEYRTKRVQATLQ